jgi:hypothetical protein
LALRSACCCPPRSSCRTSGGPGWCFRPCSRPAAPSPVVTVSLLAAGMALAVPAIVGAVALKDKRNAQETAMDGGVIRFGSNRRWGVPAVSTLPVYSAGERLRYGVQQRTMVQVPLVSGRF